MTKDEEIQNALLFEAINQKDISKIKQLLISGMNRRIVNEDNQTPLHHAAKIGNLEIVKSLLEDNIKELNLSQFITMRDKNGKTALHLAAESYSVDIISYLRNKSNNQLDTIKDNKGFTALDDLRSLQTKRKNDEEKFSADEMSRINKAIQALIENPKLKNEIALLLQYIEQGDLQGVKKLIAKYPELLESRNKYTNTPLFEAIYSKQFAIADYLIEARADVNARCHEGKISLHKAAWVKNKAIVLKLIEKGAQVNALNDHETTPLSDAAANDNNADVIEELLKHGAIFTMCDGLQ